MLSTWSDYIIDLDRWARCSFRIIRGIYKNLFLFLIPLGRGLLDLANTVQNTQVNLDKSKTWENNVSKQQIFWYMPQILRLVFLYDSSTQGSHQFVKETQCLWSFQAQCPCIKQMFNSIIPWRKNLIHLNNILMLWSW